MKDTTLEQAANDLEMVAGEHFCHVADFMRRIELERSDAARRALEEAARKIEAMDGGEAYRKARKAAAETLRRMKADF